jgi:hypothetical protein
LPNILHNSGGILSIKQSPDDLEKYLEEQIQFLKTSSASFDDGYTGESKRLAVTLRVLLHDTDKSPSLLTQLNKKDILFYDTTTPDMKGNMMPYTGLIHVNITTSGAKYVPHLSEPLNIRQSNKKVHFKDWWGQNVIRDNNKNMFSREYLILKIANKLGGAHVDPKLDQKFADLIKFNSLGWLLVQENGDQTPFPDAELVSVRQIAFEVLKSLKDEFPKYF